MESNLYKKAKLEFEVLEGLKDKPLVLEFKNEILDLVNQFGAKKDTTYRHTEVLSNTIQYLLNGTPLTPVTGEKTEWEAIGNYYTNKRCDGLKKESIKSPAYYDAAIIFKIENTNTVFTGNVEGLTSTQKVNFPFTPRSFYVEVYREQYDIRKHGADAKVYQEGQTSFTYFIKDKKQLKEIWEYYVEPT